MILSAKERLHNLIRDKKVYIYGAGDFGKTVFYALWEMKADFRGFIVSDPTKSPGQVLKKDVFGIDAFKDEDEYIILVCVNSLLAEEISDNLRRHGIDKFLCVSNEDVDELRETVSFTQASETKNYVDVLLYHSVCTRNIDPWSICIRAEIFEEQIKFISQNYRVLRFEDDWSGVKEKSIVVTFDDGYADNLKNALPILKKYNVPATIFVSTGNIDTDDRFWWDELADIIYNNKNLPASVSRNGENYILTDEVSINRFCAQLRAQFMKMKAEERKSALKELSQILKYESKEKSEAGRTLTTDELRKLGEEPLITIGAHTVAHGQLSSFDYNSQLAEMSDSKKELEQILNKKISVFSYPFGNRGDYNGDTIRAAEAAGYEKSACVCGGLMNESTGIHEIPRNTVSGNLSVDAFKSLLNKHWFEYGQD